MLACFSHEFTIFKLLGARSVNEITSNLKVDTRFCILMHSHLVHIKSAFELAIPVQTSEESVVTSCNSLN